MATLWPESTDCREALPLSEPTKQVESVSPEMQMGHCDDCDGSRARFGYCSCCPRRLTLCLFYANSGWSVVVFPGILCSCENGWPGNFKFTH